jgi:hypothetical protein
MSLHDPNINEIIGKYIKERNHWYDGWKYLGYSLEDKHGKNLGKFQKSVKIKNQYSLYDYNEKIVFSFSRHGILHAYTEILNSDGYCIGKIKTKKGWNFDSPSLIDAKNEILLKGKWKSFWKDDLLVVQDSNGKIIAEWKANEPWVLKIIDSTFDQTLLLGFILGTIVHGYTSGDGSTGG